jgi:general secretion pathway protein A
MYEEYFNLSCRPFDLSPDPKFLFMTEQHSRAVANIKFALANRDTFVIITGEIGIGKTTVLNSVFDELGDEYVVAKLTHTTLTHIELLQALLSAFGMPMYTKKKVLLLDTLRTFFLKKHKEGRHVVIIVDEAQNLSMAALEELRLLSCIDSSNRKLLSIVLTGQRGLDDLIDAPKLAQLRQRTRLRQRLETLNEEATFDYIKHRLEIAGADSESIFEADAIREVHRLSFGVPRLINTLCDTALMCCMVEKDSTVNLETIDTVVHELRWQWFEDRDQEKSSQKRIRDSVQTETPIVLTISRDGKFVDEVKTLKAPFIVGRRASNDLVLIDKEISQRHALIDCIAGIYVIEDLNSTNGILINGKRRTRALLRAGDVISIGELDVTFHADRDEREADIGESVSRVDPVIITSLPAYTEDSEEEIESDDTQNLEVT